MKAAYWAEEEFEVMQGEWIEGEITRYTRLEDSFGAGSRPGLLRETGVRPGGSVGGLMEETELLGGVCKQTRL